MGSDLATHIHNHSPRTTLPEESVVESHTVKQIRIAFEQTPIKLRIAEQGWKERRRACLDSVGRRGGQKNREVNERDTGRLGLKMGKLPLPLPVHSRRKQEVVPPTPPPTPPELKHPTRSKARSEFQEKDDMNSPRPIIAFPLPATSAPIPLGRDIWLSIPCPTSQPLHELVLQTASGRISVLKRGEILELQSSSSGTRITLIRLQEFSSWSRADREQWDMVWQLMERLKRRTPRVRVYHPLALIEITCSSPPDIVIVFSSNDTSFLSHPLEDEPDHHVETARTRTVKLVYSPSNSRLNINTSSTSRDQHTRFRTRRSITVPDVLDDSLHGLVETDWLRVEVEAIRRFCSLREEWAAFIQIINAAC